jgi:hypothetical protein
MMILLSQAKITAISVISLPRILLFFKIFLRSLGRLVPSNFYQNLLADPKFLVQKTQLVTLDRYVVLD